jgi:hypothetical protein
VDRKEILIEINLQHPAAHIPLGSLIVLALKADSVGKKAGMRRLWYPCRLCEGGMKVPKKP